MFRQVGAVVIGVIVAVAAIFAIFDERVSFTGSATKTQVGQTQQAPN